MMDSIRIVSPSRSLRIAKAPYAVIFALLFGLAGMLLPFDEAMASCTANASPSSDCDHLVISSPNLTIDVPSGVTITQTGFQDAVVTIGNNLNFSNEGTLIGGIFTPGFNNNGATSTLTNNGTITAPGDNAIINSGSIGTLTNNGMISSTSGSGNAFDNEGTITTLINSGTITSVQAAITNNATIGVLTNTGSIAELANGGSITTLNNLQGRSSAPLLFDDNLPSNYNIIIHSASNYGQLSSTSATGVMNFGIYTGSTVVAGTTYATVLNGIDPSSLSATTGTYNGYTWTLNQNGFDIWDLIISNAGGGAPAFSITAVQSSANQLAGNMSNSLAQGNVTGLNLLGGTRPVTGGSYTYTGGMFGSAEGFIGGQHTMDAVTILGGISYGHQDYDAVKQSDSTTIALAGRHTFEPVAKSLRPYVEIGGWAIPDETLTLNRAYNNAGTPASGHGDSDAYSLTGYGRAGLIYDINAQDQLVGYGELGRQSLHHDGYSETATASNPFPATVSGGTLRYDVTRWGGLFTHRDTIAGVPVSATFSGALAHSFDTQSDLNVNVGGIGSVQAADENATWGEFGAQMGVRLTPQLSGSLGLLGTSGDNGMGTQFHGLAGLTYAL